MNMNNYIKNMLWVSLIGLCLIGLSACQNPQMASQEALSAA